MISRERFEYACSLLPAGLCWNEEITPEIILHVAAMAERQALEQAKQLCEARAERANMDTLLGYGVHIGAHHCAVEIDEAIRSLNSDSSSGGKSTRCDASSVASKEDPQ